MTIDIEREFHALWGKVDICGVEMKAAEVLAALNPDAYEAAIENLATSKGYYCHQGDWYVDYEDYCFDNNIIPEPLDFTGVSNEDR